eukprot:1013694-Pelagomonas_calceolata.AAC.1
MHGATALGVLLPYLMWGAFSSPTKRKGKSTRARRPCAFNAHGLKLRKGPLASKLERASPKSL